MVFAVTLAAQTPQREGNHRGKKEKIEDIINDLTPQQKSRIDAITQRSSKIIERYRSQLDAVRDSIRLYMGNREDCSDRVFPLYEREGRLQAELSKEYYRTKVAIDAVLTPEQFRRFQQHMQNRHHQRKISVSATHKTVKSQSSADPKAKKTTEDKEPKRARK